VDRIDCSKGILHRMKAFERFLEMSPAWLGKATLLQVTPTRGPDDKRFGDIEVELAGLIARINGRFGEAAWTPIRYVNRSYSRGALAGICRLADAALVTPLRDGMNLVAKEFVAAQDSQDPGVLVLSQFAGAASELDRALIVNPHETDAVAVALKRALEMPLPERRERHATMLRRLMDWDIETWAENYVSALVESHSGRGVLDGVRSLFGMLSKQRSFAMQRSLATQ
jgi:trehalose 6-phosphate synthase